MDRREVIRGRIGCCFRAGRSRLTRPANVGCDFPFPVALVRAGRNEVVIENGGATTITIFGFELAVWSVAKTS